MIGNQVAANRRPLTGDHIEVPHTIKGPPNQVRQALATQERLGLLKWHGASRPDPIHEGRVLVDAVLLEPRPARVVAKPNYTRGFVLAGVTTVLLGATLLLGYLAFVQTAAALATGFKVFLGCAALAAALVYGAGRIRGSNSGDCSRGCSCIVIHICRRK